MHGEGSWLMAYMHTMFVLIEARVLIEAWGGISGWESPRNDRRKFTRLHFPEKLHDEYHYFM